MDKILEQITDFHLIDPEETAWVYFFAYNGASYPSAYFYTKTMTVTLLF